MLNNIMICFFIEFLYLIFFPQCIRILLAGWSKKGSYHNKYKQL